MPYRKTVIQVCPFTKLPHTFKRWK